MTCIFDPVEDCEIVGLEHPHYNSARQIFNGMVDRKPRAIIYPETERALIEVGRLVLAQDLPFSIRAGGHNVAGSSLIEDGYVIDTSHLACVSVNRLRQVADVQPGALWRDLDSTCAKFRLCTPGGIISDTGVAGLTLGGGIGWLNGLYGLACDNLVEADVLLPSGDILTASEHSNFDLLWALRGGGGNFGLVTRFQFRLHALPSLVAGSIVYRRSGLGEAMRRYVACCDNAPDELTASFVVLSGPVEPRVSIDLCYAGDAEQGRALTDKMLPTASETLFRDTRKRYSYVNWQRQFDDDLRRGRRSYWRAVYIENLTHPDFLSMLETYIAAAPSEHSMLTIDHIHGAAHRSNEATSAYGNRTGKYLFLINTNWDHSDDDQANLDWSNSLFFDLKAYSLASTYVNYLSLEGDQRIESAFGANLPRLRKLKARYDPENKFRTNQNIEPG